MMLNPVTLESSRAAIIHVHRQGHGDGALWIHQTFAIILIDAQVIGDDLKLVTRHSKYVVLVDTHEINSQARPVGSPKCSCYLRWANGAVNSESFRKSTPKPFVSYPRKTQHHKFDNLICHSQGRFEKLTAMSHQTFGV